MRAKIHMVIGLNLTIVFISIFHFSSLNEQNLRTSIHWMGFEVRILVPETYQFLLCNSAKEVVIIRKMSQWKREYTTHGTALEEQPWPQDFSGKPRLNDVFLSSSAIHRESLAQEGPMSNFPPRLEERMRGLPSNRAKVTDCRSFLTS